LVEIKPVALKYYFFSDGVSHATYRRKGRYTTQLFSEAPGEKTSRRVKYCIRTPISPIFQVYLGLKKAGEAAFVSDFNQAQVFALHIY